MVDIVNVQSIVSALVGGALRVVLELFNFFNWCGERKYELVLGQQQMELLKLQLFMYLSEIVVTSEVVQIVVVLVVLTELIKV